MAQTSTGLSGRYTIANGSVVWHELHNTNPGYAGIHTEGTIYFNRDTASKTINVTGKPINTLVGSSPYYEFDIHLGLLRNVTQTSSTNNSVDRSNLYATSYQLIPNTEVNLGRPGNNPNINISFESTVNEIIYVAYKCGQTGGCSIGYGGTSGNPHSDWVLVGSIDTKNIPYYTAHTYSINSITPSIGIHNSTQFTVTYTINGGTNVLDWVIFKLYDTNGNYIDEVSCSKNTGNNLSKTFKLSSKFKDGQQYKISLRFSDSYKEYETSNKLNLYTYRTPIISNVSLSNTSFSGFGNVTLKWSTNCKRWNTDPEEKSFQTYLKFGTDNKWFLSSNNNPVGPSTSNTLSSQQQTITQQIINNHFNIDQRCQEKVTTTLQVRRTNPSSKVNVDSSAINITVQFSPKYQPNQINYWDYNSNNTNNKGNKINVGATCYLDEHPKIVIDWTIPNNMDRGIISGYELKIYKDNTYTDSKTFDIKVRRKCNGYLWTIYCKYKKRLI